MSPPSFKKLFIFIFFLILIIFIITPFTEKYGTFVDLDGYVGLIDHSELWRSVNLLAGGTYRFGDLVCHQQFSRSLILNGSQMAICGRDFSALTGLIIGLVSVYFIDLSKGEKKWPVIFIIGAFVLLIIDWSVQHMYSLNIMSTRLVTGFLTGIAVAILTDYGLRRLNEG